MTTRPSIYDIAHLVGLSAGSVSKILNGKGSFSQSTRNRVMRAAREQGYIANFAAKTLREASTHSVGIITPDVSNEFFSSIVLDAEIMLREHGYTSYICNFSNDDKAEKDCLQGLLQKQVDGFLFVGGRRPVNRDVVGEGVPVVCVDRKGCGDSCCVKVGNDADAMAYDATRVLLSHGCRRIVYLNVFQGLSQLAGTSRYKGYRRALDEAGIAVDDVLVINGPHKEKSCVEAEQLIDVLVDAGKSFDGVMAVGDRVAVGAINSLRRHGVNVGTDVRVIGMDNTLYTRIMSPTISTVDRHTDVLAQDAALTLLGMLDGEKPVSERVVVPHEVVERETTLGHVAMG